VWGGEEGHLVHRVDADKIRDGEDVEKGYEAREHEGDEDYVKNLAVPIW
jgi:hypothetical protein